MPGRSAWAAGKSLVIGDRKPERALRLLGLPLYENFLCGLWAQSDFRLTDAIDTQAAQRNAANQSDHGVFDKTETGDKATEFPLESHILHDASLAQGEVTKSAGFSCRCDVEFPCEGSGVELKSGNQAHRFGILCPDENDMQLGFPL